MEALVFDSYKLLIMYNRSASFSPNLVSCSLLELVLTETESLVSIIVNVKHSSIILSLLFNEFLIV